MVACACLRACANHWWRGRLRARSTGELAVQDDAGGGGAAAEDAGGRGRARGPAGGGVELRGVFRVLGRNRLLAALLLCVPVGVAAHLLGWRPWVVFVWNFCAILPMAWLIGKSTEDLAASLGDVLGGLLNASFGNIVEMLLCIAGIRQGQISLVQCTLVGSMLSNMLLVLGTSFMWGGYFRPCLAFSQAGATIHSSLLLLSVTGMVLPTAYSALLPDSKAIRPISRCCAVLLLSIYGQYLVFQLRTHKHIFASDARAAAAPAKQREECHEDEFDGEDLDFPEEHDDEEEEEEEEVDLTPATAVLVLACCTALTSLCSENLISAIEGAVEDLQVSREFLGIVVLPIIGNAAEHYTAITVAGRGKLDLSLGVAVGSSCQMALLVTPFTVLAGWAMGVEVTLNFHPFQVMVLFLSTLIVANILKDGTSNWLEGAMLTAAYSVIALCYYFERGGLVEGGLAQDALVFDR